MDFKWRGLFLYSFSNVRSNREKKEVRWELFLTLIFTSLSFFSENYENTICNASVSKQLKGRLWGAGCAFIIIQINHSFYFSFFFFSYYTHNLMLRIKISITGIFPQIDVSNTLTLVLSRSTTKPKLTLHWLIQFCYTSPGCLYLQKGESLIFVIVEFCRLRISFLLLEKLCLSYGVVFLWLLIWFSKQIIVHFLWLPIFLWEMWACLYQNILLMERVKPMKNTMSWLETLLLESFLTIFYIVTGKKSAVLGLYGYYQLQCIVVIILPSRKCFQKFRFAIYKEKYLWFFFFWVNWGIFFPFSIS